MTTPSYTHQMQPDVAGLPLSKRVLDTFPELAAYPVFAANGSGAEGDRWLRFAFFYAHKDSGLQAIGDLDHKKREALRLAGIKADDPRVERVLRWQDEAARELVNQVIRNQHALKYGQWFNGTEMVWQTIHMLSVPIEADADPLPLLDGADAETVKAVVSLLGEARKMQEDKKQRAYNTKNTNFTALDGQIERLETLRQLLFMNDEQLAEAVQQQHLEAQGSAERRAVGATFVPNRR